MPISLPGLPGLAQVNSALNSVPSPVALGAQLLNVPSPSTLLPGLPTIPIPYKGKSQSKGAFSECWLVDKRTQEQFRFQFNPGMTLKRYNDLPIHKGIRSDKGVPLPGSGGEEVISLQAMYYKIDRDYDHYKALNNLRNQLSRQKDGKLPVVTLIMPGLDPWDGYIRDFSAALSNNCVDGKVSRTIEVDLELVEWSPMPAPKENNAIPADTAFYTVKEETATKKAKTAKAKDSVLDDIGEPGGGSDDINYDQEML